MGAVQHLKALTDIPEPAQEAEDALIPVNHGVFQFTSQGLIVTGDPTFEDWAQAMNTVAVMERGIAFLVGDLIRYGEERFGELAAQIIDARHWRPETVRAYVWLSEKVPMDNRMIDRGLSVKHHLAVAKLPPAEQRRWLHQALNSTDPAGPWAASRLQAAIRHGMDPPITGFYILVECQNQSERDYLQKQLELNGNICRAVDRRA